MQHVCITLDGRILELESTTASWSSRSPAPEWFYSIQSLARGNYLVSSYNEGKVHEIDGAGKVVWKYELASAYHAERLRAATRWYRATRFARVEIDRTVRS